MKYLLLSIVPVASITWTLYYVYQGWKQERERFLWDEENKR